MSAGSQTTNDSPLYTYEIASGDMRYIEINERNLYLRRDPSLGLILRGELPGCGAGCYADLSQVMLEYAMTCEGCKSPQEAAEYVANFGKRLGEILAQQLSTRANRHTSRGTPACRYRAPPKIDASALHKPALAAAPGVYIGILSLV